MQIFTMPLSSAGSLFGGGCGQMFPFIVNSRAAPGGSSTVGKPSLTEYIYCLLDPL